MVARPIRRSWLRLKAARWRGISDLQTLSSLRGCARGWKESSFSFCGAGFWKKTLNPSVRGAYYRVRSRYRRRHETQDEEDQNHETISLRIVDIRFPAPVLRLLVHSQSLDGKPAKARHL